MIKITRVKGTEIRRVWECDDEYGDKIRVIGIIGKVAELLEQNIIFEDNTKGNEDKWLLISSDAEKIAEFDTVEEAKAHAREA